jgi:hypothetical protein
MFVALQTNGKKMINITNSYDETKSNVPELWQKSSLHLRCR